MAGRKNDRQLVIVESPAKAKTIGKYLGSTYRVRASVGHIRDLPERELGVDVDNGFEPRYVTIRGKGKVIQELRREADVADTILLATDPDREGEAIAYHVAEQLGYEQQPANSGRFRRILFHEITRDAVHKALEDPGVLDMRKVEAQQARRILDRLVGYQVSPLLWKPIRPGLSAGRVQTVALRLITEREAEINVFVTEEYWSITADLEKDGTRFAAKLHHIDGKAFRLENEETTTAVVDAVKPMPFVVTDVKRRERLKNPPAPFTTSTLQQEAAKRLGFTAQRTMRIAQQLYEGVDVGSEGSVGLITYMRTDSTRVSTSAVDAARTMIDEEFGKRYLPAQPRMWTGKQQKGAQEAHEAIRPTDAARSPDRVKSFLDRDQHRLYELIWLRFVGGQMASAVYDTTTVDYALETNGHEYLFRATGSVVKFDGFTRLYQEAKEEGDHRTLDDLAPLPRLEKGDDCRVHGILPEQHFTQPPPRYTEASLVKELERLGIGRPSTYAQIISTLLDRKYVEVTQKRFFPTPLGETVARVLVRVFPDLFDVGFTSEMEAELDRIEEGELDWRGVLGEFYSPFQRQLKAGETQSEDIIREIVTGDQGKECPECGRPLVVRWNRYGRFLGCSGYPECRHTEPLDREQVSEPKPIGEKCPNCGGEMVEREGRFGAFIACSNYPKCKYTRPRTIPGLKCPTCGVGDIAEKRTRRGKPFWGCTRYPDCDWSVWDEPVPIACEVCEAPFLVRKSTKKQGEFLKCLKCNAVVAEGGDGAGDDGSTPSGGGSKSTSGGRGRDGAAKSAGRRRKTVASGTARSKSGTKDRADGPNGTRSSGR
jgi:DNA topoisomerase I